MEVKSSQYLCELIGKFGLIGELTIISDKRLLCLRNYFFCEYDCIYIQVVGCFIAAFSLLR